MKVDVKAVAKLPTKVLAKEFMLFMLFSYVSIWLCFPVMISMDLKASSSVMNSIDEIYLVQLSYFVWFFVLLALYILRFLVNLLVKKFY
jgi:hypothetical protein